MGFLIVGFFFLLVALLWVCLIWKNLGYCVFNWITNIIWFVSHFWKFPKARKMMRLIARKPMTLAELNSYVMTEFTYKSEGWDWRAWIILQFMRKFDGDCDDYAAFFKWKAKKQGWDARFYSIIKTGVWGHAVCLIEYNGIQFLADTHGIRDFISWQTHFPLADKIIKRWY